MNEWYGRQYQADKICDIVCLGTRMLALAEKREALFTDTMKHKRKRRIPSASTPAQSQ